MVDGTVRVLVVVYLTVPVLAENVAGTVALNGVVEPVNVIVNVLNAKLVWPVVGVAIDVALASVARVTVEDPPEKETAPMSCLVPLLSVHVLAPVVVHVRVPVPGAHVDALLSVKFPLSVIAGL